MDVWIQNIVLYRGAHKKGIWHNEDKEIVHKKENRNKEIHQNISFYEQKGATKWSGAFKKDLQNLKIISLFFGPSINLNI